jgi:hypothetical protein
VEVTETDWEIDACQLPLSHRDKAETWLEILIQDESFDVNNWWDHQEVSLRFATLCEWLHGFEQVVENGYNSFVEDADLEALGVSKAFLGLMAGIDQDNSLIEEIREMEIEDNADFLRNIVTRVLENRRTSVISKCLSFFESESTLFFVLWQCIWPNYRVPTREAFDEIVGENLFFGDDESYIRLKGFEFVQNGWSESAYPG